MTTGNVKVKVRVIDWHQTHSQLQTRLLVAINLVHMETQCVQEVVYMRFFIVIEIIAIL